MRAIVEARMFIDNCRNQHNRHAFMHTQSFNWSLIRSFLAALEQGSLLAAARELGVHQPTVGRHIAELEAQLGLTLFERTGRGLMPTAEAWRLAEPARAMAAGANQLARLASGAQQQIGGTVRLSASQPVACALLPAVLARMRQAHPDIQVELVVSNEVSDLLQREADLAVRMVRPEQGTLLGRRVGMVALGAYAHPDYLQRRGLPLVVEDLLAHEVIGNDRLEDITRGFAAMGHRVGSDHFGLRTDDLMAHEGLVLAGAGIGFLADYLARRSPTLVRVLPALKIPPLPMWLVVHREIRSSARIRTVWNFLVRELPEALGEGARSAAAQ